MGIRPPYPSKVFLMNKSGELFDVTCFISKCIITMAINDIIIADCTFYEANEKGDFVLDTVKMEIPKYVERFPLISAKINNKEMKIVLDASRFILPSYLNFYIGFWSKVFRALAKGFL